MDMLTGSTISGDSVHVHSGDILVIERLGIHKRGFDTTERGFVYTFIGLLFVLLCLSGATMLRTRILQRRRRRLLEQAIRNGTFVPSVWIMESGGRDDFGNEPKLWEAYVGGDEPRTRSKADKVTQWKWDTIRPLSAEYIGLPATGTLRPSTTSIATTTRLSLMGRLGLLFGHSRIRIDTDPSPEPTIMTSTTPTIPMNPALPPSDASPASEKLRVVVLIAMPHPPDSMRPRTSPPAASTSTTINSQPRIHSVIEGSLEIPLIEFGVSELNVNVLPLPPNTDNEAQPSAT